jgi:hypothetical protein
MTIGSLLRHQGGVLVVAVVCAAPCAAQSTARAGSEFRVSQGTAGHQRNAAVVPGPGGGSFVVWESETGDGSGSGIVGRHLDREGSPIGPEFLINETTAGEQTRPAVAVDATGRYTVVWTGPDGSANGVFARQLNIAGPLGPEFPVNTFTAGDQTRPHVAAGTPGVAVVWQSQGQDGSGWGVFGRLFTAAGAPTTGELPLSAQTVRDQTAPVVAVLPSRFAAAWLSQPETPGFALAHVFARVFDGGGVPLGAEAEVSTFAVPFTARDHVTIARGPAGSFFVGWWQADSFGGDGFVRSTDHGITVVQRTGDNAPTGTAHPVANAGEGSDARWQDALAVHWTGTLLVAWTSAWDVLPCFGVGGPPPECPPSVPEDGDGDGVFARAVGSGVPPAPVQVNTFTAGHQSRPSAVVDVYGNALVTWQSEGQDGSGLGVYAQRFGGLFPTNASVDATGNGVLDAGEVAPVRPSWLNLNGATQSFDGSAFGFEGPGPSTYAIHDGAAAYGPVADGATAECSGCYQVSISVPPARPAQHWDSFLGESLTAPWHLHRVWTLHVGGSFADVAPASPFYRFVETLFHHGISSGCAPGQYCPGSPITRDQMAALVLLARETAAYAPPACTTPVFSDVPASSPFCPFVEELVRRGVTAGCAPGSYCPASAVTRDQMAVFVLRTLDPLLDPPACTAPMFADVPAGNIFCRWIEELARRGVVTGCGGGNYCPGAAVTRAQVAVFLTATFGLSLY